MKTQVLGLALTALSSFHLCSQPLTETVSVGAGYVNQKWYSLQNGEVASQAKDNWDLAFEVTGYSSAIFANTQKNNFAVYRAPFSIANYSSLDTSGINSWIPLYNSDTSWTVGAFNKGADPSNPMDLGWGVYDMNTHIVTGDSCYVIKLSANVYKKLKIESLSGGVYAFEYADINGANSHAQTITKSVYSGKNFVYVDLTNSTVLDREPLSASWDLSFSKYTAILMMPSPSPYGVVGVQSNKGVSVAQVDDVVSPSTYTNFGSGAFTTNITSIGHDWKTFDLATNSWKIVLDTLYFVSDKSGSIWKLRFLSFGGSSTGDFVFTKEKLQTASVGLGETQVAPKLNVSVYPNPSSGSEVMLLLSADNESSVTIELRDARGSVVFSDYREIRRGISSEHLTTQHLSAGVYFLRCHAGSYSSVQKLIIQ